jgi:regulator of replication initiation timing
MKKILVVSLIAGVLLVGGCNESRSETQLKLEKAQIVKEFKETQASLQSKIDEQAQEIDALEARIKQQESTIEGYNTILFELVPENEKLKKENEELKKRLTAPAQKTSGKQAQEKVDQLRALQEKAKEQN